VTLSTTVMVTSTDLLSPVFMARRWRNCREATGAGDPGGTVHGGTK